MDLVFNFLLPRFDHAAFVASGDFHSIYIEEPSSIKIVDDFVTPSDCSGDVLHQGVSIYLHTINLVQARPNSTHHKSSSLR